MSDLEDKDEALKVEFSSTLQSAETDELRDDWLSDLCALWPLSRVSPAEGRVLQSVKDDRERSSGGGGGGGGGNAVPGSDTTLFSALQKVQNKEV